MKKRNAQSILEYIGVSLVFTTAGILAFAAANNQMILNYRGMDNTSNTLVGGILGPNNSEPWPDGWNSGMDPVETDLGEEGYCQQISDDPDSCTSGYGTQGDTGE